MKTNELHQVVVSEADMMDVLYRDDTINGLVVDQPHWIERFNKNCRDYGLDEIVNWSQESDQTPDEFIQANLSDWNLPIEYQQFDLENYLLSKCNTAQQITRVQEELSEFRSRDMMGILRWLKYFVDTMREHNLIWGVGRGSSVASYVLFLMDVHKVDSLKYDLNIKEFLK